MTDRIVAYVVTLDREVREDDAEQITNALRMVKGVVGVEPLVGGWEHQAARMKVDQEWRDRLITLLRSEKHVQ